MQCIELPAATPSQQLARGVSEAAVLDSLHAALRAMIELGLGTDRFSLRNGPGGEQLTEVIGPAGPAGATGAAGADGAGFTDGDKGDITIGSSGEALTLNAGTVTLAKLATPVASRLTGNRRYFENWANIGATTRTNIGNSGFTPTGTITSADDTDCIWHNYRTPLATTGSVANYLTTVQFRRNWLAEWRCRVKIVDTAVMRLFFGLSSASLSDADHTTAHYALFRYSTVAGDTNWMCSTNDGGATGTVADSGVAVVANTAYDLAIRLLASTVEFYINDVLVHTASADLPDAATSMGSVLMMSTRENVFKNVKWSRHHMFQI